VNFLSDVNIRIATWNKIGRIEIPKSLIEPKANIYLASISWYEKQLI